MMVTLMVWSGTVNHTPSIHQSIGLILTEHEKTMNSGLVVHRLKKSQIGPQIYIKKNINLKTFTSGPPTSYTT